jgi:putative transposase
LSYRPADPLEPRFTETAPDFLWVARITCIRTFSAQVYAAFVIDVFARRVLGWQLSTSLHTDLALDALEMGIWTRRRAGRDLSQLIHHSDRLNADNIEPFDTPTVLLMPRLLPRSGPRATATIVLAEAFNSLFKAELIRNKGPWRGINDLEIATAEYIDWFNHRRLHGEIGYRPPIEVENEFLNPTTPAITAMDGSNRTSTKPGA